MPRLDAQTRCALLCATDLALLLGGIELASVRRRKRYRHAELTATPSAH